MPWLFSSRRFLTLARCLAATFACLTLLSRPVSPAAQDAAQEPAGLPQIVQTDMTNSLGNKGTMIRPFGAGRHPAILHLHGSGESVEKSLVILRIFARAGYVALDVEYPESGGREADVQNAVASLELLRNSPFVTRRLIGLNGFSRGGRAALRLAMIQDVRAVSAIAARTTGGDPPTLLDDADKLKVPVLLQHGTEDPGVPYQDSLLLEQKLKSLKRRVTLVTYKGYDHNGLPWDRVYERALLFFRDALH